MRGSGHRGGAAGGWCTEKAGLALSTSGASLPTLRTTATMSAKLPSFSECTDADCFTSISIKGKLSFVYSSWWFGRVCFVSNTAPFSASGWVWTLHVCPGPGHPRETRERVSTSKGMSKWGVWISHQLSRLLLLLGPQALEWKGHRAKSWALFRTCVFLTLKERWKELLSGERWLRKARKPFLGRLPSPSLLSTPSRGCQPFSSGLLGGVSIFTLSTPGLDQQLKGCPRQVPGPVQERI